MEASGKEKAKTLLHIIGLDATIVELEKKEAEIFNSRQAIGRIADQKEKYAKEQPYFPDAPDEPIAAAELIRQQQEILARNGENQRLRENLHTLEQEQQRINDQLAELLRQQTDIEEKVRVARLSAADLHDESTAELEKNLAEIDEINRKVRANLDKDKAEEDAKNYRNQYRKYTLELEDVRKEKADLLTSAELPLPGLSVQDGELIYNGAKWDCMSGSDQLKVATAIVRKLNPKCGFVLLDKLEQMDLDTLQEFGKWLETEGLQAIATRVSTGDECSVIISDGYVEGQEHPDQEEKKTGWKPGVF